MCELSREEIILTACGIYKSAGWVAKALAAGATGLNKVKSIATMPIAGADRVLTAAADKLNLPKRNVAAGGISALAALGIPTYLRFTDKPFEGGTEGRLRDNVLSTLASLRESFNRATNDLDQELASWTPRSARRSTPALAEPTRKLSTEGVLTELNNSNSEMSTRLLDKNTPNRTAASNGRL